MRIGPNRRRARPTLGRCSVRGRDGGHLGIVATSLEYNGCSPRCFRPRTYARVELECSDTHTNKLTRLKTRVV